MRRVHRKTPETLATTEIPFEQTEQDARETLRFTINLREPKLKEAGLEKTPSQIQPRAE